VRRLAAGFGALHAATWLLIVVGALVRANGAGLACPDWPLCFGKLVPQFDLKVAFEWGHRLLAGSVALCLALLSVPALRVERVRPNLIVCWSLLALQVVFGGLTVLRQLAPWSVTGHLLIGTSLAAALLWTAADLREADRPTLRGPLGVGVRGAVLAVFALLLLQLGLGGLVSSHGAGLACASFPTCDGHAFAPSWSGLVGIHVLHRTNGFLLLGALGWLIWATRHEPRLGPLARGAAHLALVQIVLGVLNVLLKLPVELTALHSAVAAALAMLGALMLREIVRARPEPRLATVSAAVEAR
jgi:heme a synthase